MSNSTDYINTYLENVIGMMHEYLNQVLQLKTQLKLVTNDISAKDNLISELTKQLDGVKIELDTVLKTHAQDSENVNNTVAKLQKLQDENDSIKHKLGEFDALVKQFADLKNEYKNKDNELQTLSLEIETVKNSKNDEVQKLSSELTESRKLLDEKEKEIKKLEKLIPKAPVVSVKNPINTKTLTQISGKTTEENDDF